MSLARKALASTAVLAITGFGAFTQVTAASASNLPLSVSPSSQFGGGAIGIVASAASGGRSCLDNRGGKWTPGNPLQLWRCIGPAGGANQKFQLAKFRGVEVLRAVAPHGKPQVPWCVTASTKGAVLTIRHCTGKRDQAIILKARFRQYYKFADGLVMDLTAGKTANGTKVEGWPPNGGKNQQWSLPA